MALKAAGLAIELREVSLKQKPAALLSASAKATVPVLVLDDGRVIDESLDIIEWALKQNDPENWLKSEWNKDIHALIHQNDTEFKNHLDHYKYFDRYPEQTQTNYRTSAESILVTLEQRLQNHAYLSGEKACIADIAIFPFIRQFAHVDIEWFRQSQYPQLVRWLDHWLNTPLFHSIMVKYPEWQNDQDNPENNKPKQPSSHNNLYFL